VDTSAGDRVTPPERARPATGPAGADELVELLFECARQNRPVTFLIGSGVTAGAVPGVRGMLALADEYARTYPAGAGLRKELAFARAETAGDDIALYQRYRRAFGAWIEGDEFDIVAQEAVLRAYRPSSPSFSGRGRWQRVEAALGQSLERDLQGWTLPEGVAALGGLVAALPHFVQGQALTTNFDPLLEIAIARAGATAVSVPLQAGAPSLVEAPDRAVLVHHLHGFWRADPEGGWPRLMHDPHYLREHGDQLAQQVSELVTTDMVCVIGHSGWDGIAAEALRLTALAGHELTVLWAARAASGAQALEDRFRAQLAARRSPGRRLTARFFPGADSNVVLPRLADRLAVAVGRRQTVERRYPHDHWERELISEPGTAPPAGRLALVRQLDRRFQWERSFSGEPTEPRLIFWPVRLRARPSVINMVQSLAAAALSARGAKVVVCLDDYWVDDRERRTERFRHEVRRWFDLVPDANWPEIVPLQELLERDETDGEPEDVEALRRPTRPWDVAREALGERNPSVLNLLMAAKVIPDIPPEQLAENAETIVRALESRNARLLLTPFTLWAHLNKLLLGMPTASVMTLGGREEKTLWDMWRLVFNHGVHQLYNPTINSLTNQSLMVRWTDVDDLRAYLTQALADDDWAMSGHYLRWLVQNAFLLPTYLRNGTPPTFRGVRLDSWQAVRDMIAADPAVLDLIAKDVSGLYLGEETD
jgi:hypothetical protein